MKKLRGAFTALVTPFQPDSRIDWKALERNVEFQLSQGITGLVPCGTTGESPTLEWPDHRALMQRVYALVGGKAILIAGTGSNSTEEALRASREAAACGFAAVLLVEPYYNKPASRLIRIHYHGRIAREIWEINSDTQVIPYIIPGRTCCKMEPVDLALLAEQHPNVRAVKEATGDLDNMALTRQLVGPDFSILSGDDDKTATMMDPEDKAGKIIQGDGVISVMSNIAPAAVSQMVLAFFQGDRDRSLKIADQLSPLFKLVGVAVPSVREFRGSQYIVTDKFPNPCAIKTMMAGLGMDNGTFRPPLGLMTAAAVATVREALKKIWLQSPWILQPIEQFYGVNVKELIAKADQVLFRCRIHEVRRRGRP